MVKMKKVASKVRKAFEEIAKETNGPSNLCGYCCRASIQLLLAAKRNGIDGVQIVASGGHVYNVYKGHVVDITATQFGKLDPVHVAPFNKTNMEGDWKVYRGPYSSLSDFLQNSGWSSRHDGDFTVVLKHDDYEDPFQEYPYVD